jgi:methylglutaconyl-CoA hydratase
MDAETLDLSVQGPVLHARLNRPDVHNAFNSALISELTQLFLALADMEAVRAVVLGGNGKSFCAGADVGMMQRAAELTLEENRQEALALAALFHAVSNCPQPVVARVHGAALGGGAGLVACADVVVAECASVFGFTEVKLGILPAVISPFVMARIGASAARAHFVMGDRFGVAEALRIGLVHKAASDMTGLDETVDKVVAELLTSAPGAVARAKQLVRDLDVPNLLGSEALLDMTTKLIAERRASDEGKEGMAAFLERRKPKWAVEAGGGAGGSGGAAGQGS